MPSRRDAERHPPSDGLDELERRLGVEVRDRALLARALTHRSYAFEQGNLPTNERLELLGDAVLALVVTDLLYHEHPTASEGTLAKLRAAAVRASALAAVARAIDLGAFVRLGKGEAASRGADKDSILADTLEAVLGALYVDRGFDVATDVVHRLVADPLRELATRGAALDYKTSLQELSAARFGSVPVYRLAEDGPDHEKWFTAIVEVDGEVLGRGSGPSKKQAEQDAARHAYLALVERGTVAMDEEERRARTP